MNLCSLVHNNRIGTAVSESQASASHDEYLKGSYLNKLQQFFPVPAKGGN